MSVKDKKNYTIDILFSFIGLATLVVLVFGVSYAVWSNSITGTKINTLTSGYLSFNYTENDSSVINIDKALPISDEVGKKISNSNEYFLFTVSNNFGESINYEILLEPLVNNLDNKYIKIYLTDKNDVPLKGYDKIVPTVDQFQVNSSGMISIYNGVLKDKNDSQTFKLRIWISDSYVVDQNSSMFSFKVNESTLIVATTSLLSLKPLIKKI